MFIQQLYNKCKVHGYRDAQVILTDSELYSLICIAIKDLNWSFLELGISDILGEQRNYYEIPLSYFEKIFLVNITPSDIQQAISNCFNKHQDFALYIDNLCALHRRRIKYRRILSSQPFPTMDQIGPRVLLEYGECDTKLLAHWMLWRKWIYDIDNRSAQETGYLFEPLLASCLGGESIGARNSPVKRVDPYGNPMATGRQIDCLVLDKARAYELKLRVTIAASGQGRFGEELSFPVEARAAGFTPVLLVLDPTPSSKLDELSKKFIESGGEFYKGEEAWSHMEREAGEIVSVFIEKYIKPVIQNIEEVDIDSVVSLTLASTPSSITIKSNAATYSINRV